jgi:hypothetical protein
MFYTTCLVQGNEQDQNGYIFMKGVIQCGKKYKINSVNKPINNDCY